MGELSIYEVIVLWDLVEELTKEHAAENIIAAAEQMVVTK